MEYNVDFRYDYADLNPLHYCGKRGVHLYDDIEDEVALLIKLKHPKIEMFKIKNEARNIH